MLLKLAKKTRFNNEDKEYIEQLRKLLDVNDDNKDIIRFARFILEVVNVKSELRQYKSYYLNEKLIKEFSSSLKAIFNESVHRRLIPRIITKDSYKIFEMPMRSSLSAGKYERLKQLLTYISAKSVALNKPNHQHILFIDEVFDNVDETNLFVALIYMNKLIKTYDNITVAFTTHLEPSYFNIIEVPEINYIFLFKSQKIKLNGDINYIVNNRDDLDEKYEELISRSYLHFDSNPDIASIKVKRIEKTYEGFVKILSEECLNYKEGKYYCPLSVAIMLRKSIESKNMHHLMNFKKLSS